MTLHMRTRTIVVTGIAGVALAALALPAAVNAATADTTTGLTNAQLTEMREEERMARDLYTQLAKTSGSQIFTRIAASEQRHLDAVERLMTSQGMDADAAGSTVGTYAVPDLQKAYDGWLAEGRASDVAAYTVGTELEKQDIADLEALDPKPGTTAERVVEALLNASEHHLAAFTKAVNGDTAGVGPGSGMGPQRWGEGTGRQGRGDPRGDGTCPYGEDRLGQGPTGDGPRRLHMGAAQVG